MPLWEAQTVADFYLEHAVCSRGSMHGGATAQSTELGTNSIVFTDDQAPEKRAGRNGGVKPLGGGPGLASWQTARKRTSCQDALAQSRKAS